MNKIRSTYIILFLFSMSYGQELIPVFEDTINENNVLKISSFNYYSSNRFSNDLMDKFILGGEVTNDIKDRSLKRLKNFNSIGGEFEQSIANYAPNIHPLGKEKYGLLIHFSDNHFVSSNIPSAVYKLGLYGNTSYLGDTMDLTFGHLKYQHYQKLSIGLYDKKTLSSVTIGYVAGSKGFSGRLNESYIHSSADSDSISAGLDGSGFVTERLYPYVGFRGNGFSVDLNLNFLFYSKNGLRQIINLKVNNAGVIFWNKDTRKYDINNMLSYSGFEFNQLNNQTNLNENKTILDTLGYTERRGVQIDPLPIELVAQKLPDRLSPNKLQAIFGFKTVLISDYVPYLFVGGYYQPTENFSASTRVSYGGFGGLQWGIQFNYWMKDKANFFLSSHDLLGVISKKIGMGRSLNFGMNIKLK